MMQYDVLIVGAGHAGSQVAISLRQQKFAGSIGIVGDEPELPYERPPLSKEYLAGEKPFSRLLLRSEEYWKKQKIDLILSQKVNQVNPTDKYVSMIDGTKLSYNKLVWACGGTPRKLTCPGSEFNGIHVIRNRADIDNIKSNLSEVQNIVIVGGGYIGLEAAAVLQKFDKKITIIENSNRILSRMAGSELSTFLEDTHRKNGIEIKTNQNITSFISDGDTVKAALLSSGEKLKADMIIIGIGILPSVTPLINAGAEGENGVNVDEYCQTTLKDIFAVGDCASHKNSFAGGKRIRLESVQNANDQAITAAKMIMESPKPYTATPWFWSNQYHLKLQTVGLSTGYDSTVIRGDISSDSFSVIYLKEDRVIAIDSINSTKDWIQGRNLVEAGAKVSRSKLSDTNTPLKALL